MHYAVAVAEGRLLVRKRKNEDIWRGLYEFPIIGDSENVLTEAAISEMIQPYGLEFQSLIMAYGPIIHKLSHRHIYARFYICQTVRINTITHARLV